MDTPPTPADVPADTARVNAHYTAHYAMQRLVFIGGLINSALYLGGVLLVAIVEHNRYASRLALIAIGLTFLAYLAQVQRGADSTIGAAIAVVSIVAGIGAGLALLFGG